jgi:hypothetical protein
VDAVLVGSATLRAERYANLLDPPQPRPPRRGRAAAPAAGGDGVA